MFQQLDKLRKIIDQYDVFLIDAWGVLHDGGHAFPHATSSLKSLGQGSKHVVILSNAARRSREFDLELTSAGIDSALYDFSLSSGELFWQNFKNGHYEAFGTRCFYLGPKRSQGIIDGLELIRVESLENADFVLNTGAEGNQLDAISFTPLLEKAIKLRLPMICVNPDSIAIRKGVRGISAGAIADLYQQLGGEVEFIGKPHEQIFQQCVLKLAGIQKSRMLMIGDGLQTDILGANKFGIDSLFIRNGIYREQIETEIVRQSVSEKKILQNLFLAEGAEPDFIIAKLIF
jgi:HAD superfamily hydrolase (TIGR01459 family)